MGSSVQIPTSTIQGEMKHASLSELAASCRIGIHH